jgi:oligopeptide/dipeptide ABC transporter ATP-binding protein
MWQVHHRPGDHAGSRADERPDRLRGSGAHLPLEQRDPATAAPHADGLPGSHLVVEPAAQGQVAHTGTAEHLGHRQPGRADLLEDLKEQYGLTLLFIAHDLAVVKNISDRIAVMYLGKLCEVAAPDALFAEPAHPYTIGLLHSIPVPDPDVRVDPSTRMVGEVPSPIDPPSGCRMRYRCPYAQQRCTDEEPQLRDLGGGHFVACHFPVGRTEAQPERNGP